jgi:two-component system CheB/CheR fusion protein
MNEASLSPLSTLIVDDSVNTAASLAMLVEGWGHRAMVAHDGPSALQLAGENSFDVVFLDVGMPQMTGWDLAQRLRQLPTTADAYLVVISGYGQDLNKVVSQAAGCDLHLVKPTEPEVLRVLLSSRQRAKQAQGSRA